MKLTRVSDLREGDMVDLEGDPYTDCSDPWCEEDHATVLEHTYAIVDEPGELETPECMVVSFSNVGVTIGFPPGHMVRVERRGLTPVAR